MAQQFKCCLFCLDRTVPNFVIPLRTVRELVQFGWMTSLVLAQSETSRTVRINRGERITAGTEKMSESDVLMVGLQVNLWGLMMFV